jgi:hypothetical protein
LISNQQETGNQRWISIPKLIGNENTAFLFRFFTHSNDKTNSIFLFEIGSDDFTLPFQIQLPFQKGERMSCFFLFFLSFDEGNDEPINSRH